MQQSAVLGIVALVVIAVVLFIAGLARATSPVAGARVSKRFTRDLRTVVRTAAQYGEQAAQDQRPLIALMHVDCALAYVRVARLLAPDDTINRVCSTNIEELASAMESLQNTCMQRIHSECPSLQPDGIFAANCGWLA